MVPVPGKERQQNESDVVRGTRGGADRQYGVR